jgi:hypothetical protein
MKAFLTVLIVLAAVSPLCADTLFQEDFNGTPGSDFNGYNGWSVEAGYYAFSSNVIDQGTSLANVVQTPYTPKNAYHIFTNTAGAGDTLTFTATLDDSYNSNHGFADLRLLQNDTGKEIRFNLQGGDVEVQSGATYDWYTSGQGLATADFKVVVSDTRTDAYYRPHGATDWTVLGGGNYTDDVTLYNFMHLYGLTTYGGGWDSIKLTAGATVPEPSVLALCASGLIGLLAYAWRRRK